MRTSVNIETDAYDFACAYAHGKGITLGAAISELLRYVERAEPELNGPGKLTMNEHGYYEIIGGTPISADTVKKLSEDEVG